MGKLKAKRRNAVPVCLLVEGKELLPALRLMVPSAHSSVSIWNIIEPALPIGFTKAGSVDMAQALDRITVPPASPAVITTASQTYRCITNLWRGKGDRYFSVYSYGNAAPEGFSGDIEDLKRRAGDMW
jgi:hypothetical protein